MTDKIPKPIHTIRKVSLQQNHDQSKILSNFLLTNDTLLSIKKSYELVPRKSSRHDMLLKPSLKLNRNAPTNKSVRFDMPLVQVLHFHSPMIEEEYEEEEEDEEEEEEDEDDYYVEEEESDLEDAFLEIFSRGLSPPQDTESHLFPQYLTDPSFTDSLALKLTNWPSIHAKQRSLSHMVSLESLAWENARSVIKGSILVHNVAFEKSVIVRMSFNHWQTWIDVEATYKESVNGALDRFSFELVTPNHLSYLNLISTSSSCSMAVRYQVNGQEYWDNNSQNNFNVQWVSCGGNKIVQRKADVVKKNPISFYPTYNQEQELKNEEYSTCFITGMFMAPSCDDKSNYFSTEQRVSAHFQSSYFSTEQRISAHFQSYLDKRQPQPRYSVQDHHAIMSVPSPPLCPLLIPPSRNDLVLT